MSYISAMPEKNLALVQMRRVPNKHGHMTVNLKEPDQHYSYVDMSNFVWKAKDGVWKRRGPAKRLLLRVVSGCATLCFKKTTIFVR